MELRRRDSDVAHSTKSFGPAMTFIEHKKKQPASKIKTEDPQVLQMWGGSGGNDTPGADDIEALFEDGGDDTSGMERKTIRVPRDDSNRVGIDFDNDTLEIVGISNKIAVKNGLLVGHRIVEIDGVPVKGKAELVAAVQGKDVVNMTIVEDPKRFAFINLGRTRSGRLGFDFNNSTLSVEGVSNEQAARMGLKPGQRIISVDGKPVRTKDELVRSRKDSRTFLKSFH